MSQNKIRRIMIGPENEYTIDGQAVRFGPMAAHVIDAFTDESSSGVVKVREEKIKGYYARARRGISRTHGRTGELYLMYTITLKNAEGDGEFVVPICNDKLVQYFGQAPLNLYITL